MKYPFNVISSIIPPSSSSFTAPLLPPVLPHAGGDKWLGSIYFNLAHLGLLINFASKSGDNHA